jgi:copper homeostasis protein CutC
METFSYEKVIENTFTECLKRYGSPNTFLNIRKAKENKKLIEYLNSEFTIMSGAGAQVRNSQTEIKEIGKAFDGIIYLNKTSKINWAE